MLFTTHLTVGAQQLCCMQALQVSVPNEIPDAFRSHAPPVPEDDGAVVPLVPLEPLEPLEPLVSGSGPSVGVEVVCFDEHAKSSNDASTPTPHDIRREGRMLSIKHATCPSVPAVFRRFGGSARRGVDRKRPTAIACAPGPTPRAENCNVRGEPGSSPRARRSG